jgi:hypothetical protein
MEYGCMQTHLLETNDAYLKLILPNLTLKIFAPGIVSNFIWLENCQIELFPKGNDIYWSKWSSNYPKSNGTSSNE